MSDITRKHESALTPFEEEMFQFIRDWISGVSVFTLMTSGSTGSPKKITVKRSQMEASASSTLQTLGLKPGDSSLICLDTRYVGGKMMIVRSLFGGLEIIATEPVANPLENLQYRGPISFTALVPYQLQKIITSVERDMLNNFQIVIVGGAAISDELLPHLDPFLCRFFSTYGMTETISHIALKALNGGNKHEDFYTLPGIKIDVDQRGCLVIEAFYLEQPLVTNDLVEITGMGRFRWHGRIDNVINSGGVKVSPEIVESQLNSLKSQLSIYSRMVVSSVPDPLLGEKVVCVVEGATAEARIKEQILVAFSKVLDRFHTPKDVIFMPSLPETSAGKIDRIAIRNLLNKRP